MVCRICSCDSVAIIIDCGTDNHSSFHSTTGCYTSRDCTGAHDASGHLTPGDLATTNLATTNLATSDESSPDATEWWRIWLLRGASPRTRNRPDDDGRRSP